MARPPRIHYPGALFHVISRGSNKQDIFLDAEDKIVFLERLRRVKRECGFSLYAYCLMTNHIHLLLKVRETSQSIVMLRLLSGYSREFNRKWERRGHLFEAHHKALHCANDRYFRELVRYIHMNPVSAGIVDSPEKWNWSGYNEVVGLAEKDLIDVSFVQSFFGGGPEAVSAFTLKKEEFDLGWIERDRDVIPSPEHEDPIVITKLQPLESLELSLTVKHGIAVGALAQRTKIGLVVKARGEFISSAARMGHSTASIARFLGRNQSVICRIASRRNAS